MRKWYFALLAGLLVACGGVGDAVDTGYTTEMKQEFANATATAVRTSNVSTIQVGIVENYSSYNETVRKVNLLLGVLELPLDATFEGLPTHRAGYQRFRNDTEALTDLINAYNALVNASRSYDGDSQAVIDATQGFMTAAAWFTVSSTYSLGSAIWNSVRNTT